MLRSLVGSEMCIRDRMRTAASVSGLWAALDLAAISGRPLTEGSLPPSGKGRGTRPNSFQDELPSPGVSLAAVTPPDSPALARGGRFCRARTTSRGRTQPAVFAPRLAPRGARDHSLRCHALRQAPWQSAPSLFELAGRHRGGAGLLEYMFDLEDGPAAWGPSRGPPVCQLGARLCFPRVNALFRSGEETARPRGKRTFPARLSTAPKSLRCRSDVGV